MSDLERAHRWAPKRQFIVLRVNGDERDTHAAETFEDALDLALPDDGARLEWFIANVQQWQDAGFARLVKPEAPVSWQSVGRNPIPEKFRR